MPCTCDFAILGQPRLGFDHSDDLFKLPTLALNFELIGELSRLTTGSRFYWCQTDRPGDCIDPCGVTLIPHETLPALKSALTGLNPDAIFGYDADFDDSPYPLTEQITRLCELIDSAFAANEWLICFGA